MIKTLQRKFIITAMTAITVLIFVMIGTINGINIWRVNNESDNTMQMLVDSLNKNVPAPGQPGDSHGLEFPISQRPFENDFGVHEIFNPSISEDMVMAARYFSARIDTEGNIIYLDVSHVSSVDEDEAREWIWDVLEDGKADGSYEEFRYKIAASKDGQGSIIVFINVSNIRRNILSVLIISVIIGILGWTLMLLLVMGLSKHAIYPIAENIEKQKMFVTDAGHEIKTPLAIIIANTDAMELHNGENKWSKNIRSQAERLSGLMKNLLSLSRMDEGNTNIQVEDIDMSSLADNIANAFAESAAAKGVEIKKNINPNVRLRANREHMTQLFTILLDNAVKYSVDNEYIEFSIYREHHDCVIRCKNKCEQLPDVPADRLFDRFYRGDSARTQKNGGYGIGLSIAKAIVEVYKGKIGAEYINGSEIVFKITL